MKKIAPGLVLLLVAACNSTGRMELPPTTGAAYFDVDPTYLKSITFDRTVYRIPRGTVIGHFPHFSVGVGDPEVTGNLCNNRHAPPSLLEWSGSSRELHGWSSETGEVFFDVLSARGFNIVGNPDAIFEHGADRDKAELLVGARIVDMRGNFCEDHDIWRGFPLGRYSGVAYTEVEWALFDPLAEKQIAEFTTTGTGKKKVPSRSGIADAYLEAFAAAAESLATDPGFVEAITKDSETDGSHVKLVPAEGDTITLTNTPLSGGSITSRMPLILPSVVTISLGQSHGSGFIISDDGLILTNYHVVGEKESVNVVLSNEITLPATVLRRHKLRDVALLKVQISSPKPLPLKPDGVVITQKVFAIGSPLLQSLKNTVSAGIVSALRPYRRSGVLPLIQADVDIHGGNSGGPLLDEFGNVVGISVSGHGEAGSDYSVGLNFFIPIESALQFLNIVLEQPSSS